MNKLIVKNQAGLSLCGLSFIPEEMKYLLIICHGFKGAKENSGHLFAFADSLNKLHIGVWAFDFTGSGESEGDFSSISLTRQIKDLQCLINYADKEFDLPLLLLGRSFGGTTVISAGGDSRIKACILWSAPVFLEETFTKELTDTEYKKISANQAITRIENNQPTELRPDLFNDFRLHNMEQYLSTLKNKPVLVVQGLADETVIPDNAEYIYKILPHADLHMVPGADHRFTGMEVMRQNLTLQWLQKHFL